MQIESVLSGVLSGGSSLPLHRMAARLRPVEESQAVNKLPENDCGNCGTCPNCQAQAAAEASSGAAFGVVDIVELSPVALTEVRTGADPDALKRRGDQQPTSESSSAATYDAFGRGISDGGVSGEAASEAGAQEQTAEQGGASPGTGQASQASASADAESSSAVRNYEELSEEEQQQVDELKARDTEVRQHEQAHLAAAGQYATGGPTYEYQTGPDGNKYAIGGEVQIDTSPVEGDPEATIQKMQTVIAAALAPAEPSGQDRSVASQARAALAAARAELAEQRQAALSGGEGEGEGEAGVDGAAALSAATGSNPAESAASKAAGSKATGSKSAASTSDASNSGRSTSNGATSNEANAAASQPQRGPQLYTAQGAAAASNDGRELARELDLVA